MNSPLPYMLVQPVEVGEHSYVSEYCHISQYTKIGRYSSIGNLCTIGAQPHLMDGLTTYPYVYPDQTIIDNFKKTAVGNDVWIGSNSVVLAGVTIGDGAIIGAGSVVTKDVAPYAIVAGVPVRLLRYRFDRVTIMELLRLKWWELSIEEVKMLPLNDVGKCIGMMKMKRAA